MDRMIHTVLNALHNTRDLRVTQAQNLANQNVPGFRRDLDNSGNARFLESFDTVMSRVFNVESGPAGFSDDLGFMNRTENPMDFAISDKGYFFIKPENGEPALSRRGDFRRDAEGMLRDGAGDFMLDTNLNPINLPEYEEMLVSDIGEIRIRAVGEQEFQLVAMLGAVGPVPVDELHKGPDGFIRYKDGTIPDPDQNVKIVQGVLEGSNVNPVEELISTMETQRNFEIGFKLITQAQEMDEAASRLLKAPE